MTNTILDCGHPESKHSNFTRGYGTDSQGKKHCYDCCAEKDKVELRQGKTVLYFNGKEITNWIGNLRFKPTQINIGKHNMAGKRYDTWFRFENNFYHGVTYGDNTQIHHIKQIKKPS